MHHSFKMYFHVNPKKSQVHRSERLRLLMKIVRIKIKKNLVAAKEKGQKKSFGLDFLTYILKGEPQTFK